jgi:hypothetical protein
VTASSAIKSDAFVLLPDEPFLLYYAHARHTLVANSALTHSSFEERERERESERGEREREARGERERKERERESKCVVLHIAARECPIRAFLARCFCCGCKSSAGAMTTRKNNDQVFCVDEKQILNLNMTLRSLETRLGALSKRSKYRGIKSHNI